MNLIQIIIIIFLYIAKSYASVDNNDSIDTNFKAVNISRYKYLDDVINGLKLQNWTNEELPCLNATLHWMHSLQNFTTWAVWEWDSISSPVGLLSGNLHILGNFDQCMMSPWKTHHPEIASQYCLATVEFHSNSNVTKRWDEVEPYGNANEIILHKTDRVRNANHFLWGVCVPSICQHKSVERFVKVLLARSHLGTTGLQTRISIKEACQKPDEVKGTDAAFHGYLAFVLVMFTITIVCTCLSNRGNENGICKAFCIKRNTASIFKISESGLDSVNGIRFLTMFIITMCHVSSTTTTGPLSNGIKLDRIFVDVGWLVSHSDLTVDTFFTISGLLVAKTLLGYNTLPPIPIMVFRRYLRLAVGLAVSVLFMAAVLPYTGSGPLWNSVGVQESKICRETWWINLLMLANYVKASQICLPTTWYIPIDFHLFCITVILLAIYKRNRRIGKISIYITLFISVITAGVIHYMNDFPPIFILDYEHVVVFRENPLFIDMYIRSHNRAAAYFVGVLFGILYDERKNRDHFNLSKRRSVIYSCVAVLVMMGVLVSGGWYLKRSYSTLEGVLYGAVNRPVFAAGLSLLIMACAFGNIPLLSSFLKWHAWAPLSRLSYGVYLIHYIILTRTVGSLRNIRYYDDFNIVLTSVGVTGICLLLSYIMWLFFEGPINNIVTLFFLKRDKNHGGKELINTAPETEKGHKEVASALV